MLTAKDREEIKQLVGAMIADVLARAIEVSGEREKSLRWLRTPVRSLGDKTPISLLNSPEGLSRVQDTLGQIEHGVW
jgi:putative toxin-antitoxin system antitoxin component (TIGR02293 family)